MSQQYDHQQAASASSRTQQGAVVDAGLRSYMLTVYNYMTAGVALTGIVAYLLFTQAITNDPALAAKTATGQVHGAQERHVSDRPRHGALRLAVEVGHHAGTAGIRVLPVIPCLQDERGCGADFILAVRSRYGRIAVVDLPGLHRAVDRAGVLHHRSGVCRAQPLWLHDQVGSFRLGFVPDHGL